MKNILITGGTGTLGNALANRLMATTFSKITIFSRDELKQFEMAKRLPYDRMRFFLGDVRDLERLKLAFRGVDTVIHAAALKQVSAVEYNPFEAIKTNVIGTENVISAARSEGVKKVLLVSTDKAVHPVNLYGATKLCAEKIAIASNAYTGGVPKVSVIRYGNVMGSRGSLLSNLNQEHLELTDPKMTRFWIEVKEAATHVLEFLKTMEGGEIYVPKLESRKVVDILKEKAPNAKIKVVGMKPGEKLHEILISDEEVKNTYWFEDHYIVTPEADWWEHEPSEVTVPSDFKYSSKK